MVEVNAENVEVNDVPVVERKKTIGKKIAVFTEKHKNILILGGAVVLGIGAVVVKTMLFSGEAEDIDVLGEATDTVVE